VVSISAFTEIVWLDERRASCTGYEWLGRFDHEWNADVDLLEQVRGQSLQHYTATLTVSGTLTIQLEPS